MKEKKQNLLNRLKKWLRPKTKATITIWQCNELGGANVQARRLVINNTTKDGVTTTTILKDNKIKD